MRRWTSFLALVLVQLASAYSVRPGSLLIFYTGATALVCARLSAILAAFAFTRSLPYATRACLALLVVHPAWTIIGSCCDCGASQSAAAMLDVILSASVFFWDLAQHRPPH